MKSPKTEILFMGFTGIKNIIFSFAQLKFLRNERTFHFRGRSVVAFLLINACCGPLFAKEDAASLFRIVDQKWSSSGHVQVASKNDSLVTNSQGKHWLSFQIQAPASGYYVFNVDQKGGGSWDVFIDGERFLGTVQFKSDGENSFPEACYLEAGPHSVIFYSENSGSYEWRSFGLEQTKDPEKPVGRLPRWQEIAPYVRLLKIGRMFSGNYINVNIARDTVLFTRDNYQYLSYYNPEGFIVVGRRELHASYFEKYWVPIPAFKAPQFSSKEADFDLHDPHNFISTQMDGDGFIHLAYGQHNKSLKYLRSKNPHDISQWETQRKLDVSVDQRNVTYVSFVLLKNGDLLALYRVGAAGSGYYVLLRYEVKNKTWKVLFDPFITDDGKSSPYLWRPVVSPDGVVHIAWTWRFSDYKNAKDGPLKNPHFSGFTNQNICYAKSLDEGKTWLCSSGSAYGLPIKRIKNDKADAEVIQEIPMGQDFFNHYGADYDASGQPQFTYTRWNNAQKRVPQQWHLHRTGKGWQSDIVTDYREHFSWTALQQQGLASTYLSRPSMVVDTKTDTAIVISRSRENANQVELYLSGSGDYAKWRQQIVYPGSTGGWEPQLDLDLWHRTSRLQMILAGITDDMIVTYADQTAKPLDREPVPNVKKWSSHVQKPGRNTAPDYYAPYKKPERFSVDAIFSEDAAYLLEFDYAKFTEGKSV